MQQESNLDNGYGPLRTRASHPYRENNKQDQPARDRSCRNSNCTGFTLIEVATTLVAIALLFNGILKAQAITETSRAYQLENDFRSIPLYISEYQGRFNSLPGDDVTIGTVNTHLKNALPCPVKTMGKCMPGNGIIDGLWNDTTPASESYLFWQQIRLAGFVSGDTDTASSGYPAKNVVGGSLGVTSQASNPIIGLKGAIIVCSDGIAGRLAKQIDIALDDGGTDTGAMMVTARGTSVGGTALANDAIADDQLYLVCMGI